MSNDENTVWVRDHEIVIMESTGLCDFLHQNLTTQVEGEKHNTDPDWEFCGGDVQEK